MESHFSERRRMRGDFCQKIGEIKKDALEKYEMDEMPYGKPGLGLESQCNNVIGSLPIREVSCNSK